MNDYDPKQIEPKWQKTWAESGIYNAKENSKPKWYSLVEFPYPSGDGLHVGHPRPYIGMDVVSRKRRMQGFDVLFPIGWDAFGLPTENYAIKTGRKPADITKENTDTFRKQIQNLGISFDWSREINTTDPAYYKWTQWLFLKFYEKGLAYKAKQTINWCPKDKIGLANEEVVDGKCERCGTPVEKRDKEQWMLKITAYADRLDKDLDTVDYPDRVKVQQRNWIGRSEGAEINFELDFKKDPKANENRGPNGEKAAIKVFTTRPDTIFGATYLVLAPEHPWVKLATDDEHDVLENKSEIIAYIDSVKNKEDIERTAEGKEKTGVELKGVKAINPATKEEIPMWVADYVLPHYGTGAIMAVPAHDERDFEFAQKFNLPIKQVVAPYFEDFTPECKPRGDKQDKRRRAVVVLVKHWSEDKYIVLQWKKLNWRTLVTGGIEEGETAEDAAKRELLEETGYSDIKKITHFPQRVVSYFFAPHKDLNMQRDGSFMVIELGSDTRQEVAQEEQDKHEVVWTPRNELISFLDYRGEEYDIRDAKYFIDKFDSSERNDRSVFSGSGMLIDSGEFSYQLSAEAKDAIITFVGGEKKITFKLRDWVFSRQRYWGEPIPVVHCEKDGWVPVPESELPVLLPNVEKYEPTDNGESPLAVMTDWVNTICPKCGGPAHRETDTMPNWAGSSWYFLRYVDPHNNAAFASKEALKHWMPVDWYNGGMEHTTLHLLYSRFWNKFFFDLGLVPTSEPYQKRTSHGLIMAEDGRKMSKSLGNVINPDRMVEMFGADSLRVYEMFMGPFEQAIAWSENSLVGTRRFIERVWKLRSKMSKGAILSSEDARIMHEAIKKVSEDIESLGFNTAIATLMSWVNMLDKRDSISSEEYKNLVLLLAPFAPHVTEEIWAALGEKGSVHEASWPAFDESKLARKFYNMAVQVNGKLRATLEISASSAEEEVKSAALALPEVEKWLNGAVPKKVIIVLGKIVNIVV